MDTDIFEQAEVLRNLAVCGRTSEDILCISFDGKENEAKSPRPTLAKVGYGRWDDMDYENETYLDVYMDESIMPKAYICKALYKISHKNYKCSVTLNFSDKDTRRVERCLQMSIASTYASKYVDFQFHVDNEKLPYLVANWIQTRTPTKIYASIVVPESLTDNHLPKSISSYKAIMSSSIKSSEPVTFTDYHANHIMIKIKLFSWFKICSTA